MTGGAITQTGTATMIGVGNTSSAGTFLQSGGTVTNSGTFAVGHSGAGTYDLEDGTMLISNGSFQIGSGAAATIIQNGGTISASSAQLGLAGTASYTMGGGTLSVANGFSLGGLTGVGRGTFTQNGASSYVSVGSLNIGADGTASYTQNGGSLSVSSDMIIGGNKTNSKAGVGTFTQTAGSLSIGGNLYINSGYTTTGDTGYAVVTGNGSINLASTSTVFIGLKSSGSFNFCSTGTDTGTAILNSQGTLTLGSFQGNASSGNYGARFLMGNASGADPTVSFGTINFGAGNNATVANSGQTRLVTVNSGTLNVNCVDLTSYYTASVNQATLEYTGATNVGTLNIGSMIFGGGRYYQFNAAASQSLNSALYIEAGSPGTGITNYAGGGTIQASGSLLMSGAINNAGAVLNFGSIGVNSDNSFGINQGTVTFTGAETNSAGSEFNVTAGELDLQADGGSNLALYVNGSSATNTASPAVTTTAYGKAVIGGGALLNGTENLGTLSIGSLGTVGLYSAAPAAMPALLLHVGTLSIDGGASPTGTLDMAADDAIVDNGNLSTIQAQVKSGFNGGAWNGAGIQSTRAALHSSNAGIGYASASEIGTTFDGVSGLSPTAVLLKYTLLGDANMDGTVNALDFNALATNYGQSGMDWAHGDFNYSADGTVDSSDFDLLAANYGSVVATSPNDAPLPADAAGGLGSVVPEPMSFSLLAISGLGLLQRRRRA
jgi:hypothetical protein